MAPPPPELNTDAISEILLRLSPEDPAGLVRASAVCKPWFRTLTDPAFLRRYRDFHDDTPRVLGFLHNPTGPHGPARFVSTTAFRPHAAAAAHRTCAVEDCRHGRVLLYDYDCEEFVVWDPVTGRERRIPNEEPRYRYKVHAVLCAAGAGCDHSNCSGGPFLLASAGAGCNNCGESVARFYSSETDAWSAETSISHGYFYSLEHRPPGLVGGALYFDAGSEELLRYDVLGDEHDLLLMGLPPPGYHVRPIVMTAANGGLGLATFDLEGMLNLWSAETDAYGDVVRWSHDMLIDLQELLPVDISCGSAWLSGFAEEANLMFLSTDDDGIFTIDLSSLLVREVCEIGNVRVSHVVPYVSFYTPAAFARGHTSITCGDSVIL